MSEKKKKSEDVGQAFTRRCEEWGVAVGGSVIYLWGDRLRCFCSVLHPRENPPGSARHCSGGTSEPLQMKLQVRH